MPVSVHGHGPFYTAHHVGGKSYPELSADLGMHVSVLQCRFMVIRALDARLLLAAKRGNGSEQFLPHGTGK